jgi:hypothetical protein
MKTTSKTVSGTISIWAVPRTDWEVENSDDNELFDLELYSGDITPYREGAVHIHTEAVYVECPAGIDMVQAAVDTLHDAKEREGAQYAARIGDLNKKIAALLRLSHTLSDEDGNVIPINS